MGAGLYTGNIDGSGELIDPIGTIRSRYPNVMQIIREEAVHASVGDGSMQESVLIRKEILLLCLKPFIRR